MPYSNPIDGRLSNVEAKISAQDAELRGLSARVDKAEPKLEDLMQKIVRLDERVSHLPSKEYIVRIALGTLALIGAIVVFSNQIRSFFHL
jgi:uncharacterized coiled-coil protein SlyX